MIELQYTFSINLLKNKKGNLKVHKSLLLFLYCHNINNKLRKLIRDNFYVLILLELTERKTLKVLMVSTEFPPMPGGVGRYTFNLTQGLRKLGLEVLVVCNEKGNGDFYGLSPKNKENAQVLLNLVSKV